jgi:hypothetical protein
MDLGSNGRVETAGVAGGIASNSAGSEVEGVSHLLPVPVI